MESQRSSETFPKVTQLAILGLSSGLSDPVVLLLVLLQAVSRLSSSGVRCLDKSRDSRQQALEEDFPTLRRSTDDFWLQDSML